MEPQTRNWLEDFLGRRELRGPDARALYAYRCSQEEFESLANLLVSAPPYVQHLGDVTVRAFVLYASEWWQRKYDGGTWAWEPLLESIEWERIHYPELYEPVKRAWKWWNVEHVSLPSSIRYLGTFACQGGLPLALVGDAHSSVTRYLRAVVKHVAAYRALVDDPIVLAEDQQHLLRPPTLRRDYVFQLAAELAEAVLELSSEAKGDDPLNALDEARPDWRRTMPLALEDERARELLTGLLKEAARNQAAPVDEFRMERFLRPTGTGWRIGARLRLPATIQAETLARQLQVRQNELPARLQVRTSGEGTHVVGLYAAQGDDFLLHRDRRSLTELWDHQAAGEVRLEFLAGGVIGKPLVPGRGGALSALPWAFRGGDDGSLIGEGSVSNRSSEILVLVPDGCTPNAGEMLAEPTLDENKDGGETSTAPVRVLGRTLWKISSETVIETERGRCVVKPASEHAAEEEYRLSGARFYGLECRWPLFQGRPRLRLTKDEQATRAVPAAEVGWRQGRGDWKPEPTGFGLWEVRHVRAGELRHFSRAGILPDRLAVAIEPGADMSQGHIVLKHGEDILVAGNDSQAEVAAEPADGHVRVRVSALDTAEPPVRVQLRLHWPHAQELSVQAPFPGHGARILREGERSGRLLAVDDLYGVRAIALSPDATQEFWIEGELKAPDVGKLLRVAHFRERLRKSGVSHELPLVDVRDMIDLLLSASSSSDAHVAIQVVDRYQKVHEEIRVSRFSAAVECNPDISLVSISPGIDGGTAPKVEALPLARPGDDPMEIEAADSADLPQCAVLPDEMDLGEPWLLVVRHDERIRARPCTVGGSPRQDAAATPDQGRIPSLAEALAIEDPELRTEGLGAAMDAMLAKEAAEWTEDDWSFLRDSLLRAESLPPSALDLLRVLVTKPKLLIRCLFALESAPRQLLWRLEDELPFSWLLIRRQTWWKEAMRAFVQRREQLAGIIDQHEHVARELVVSILAEGKARLAALEAVSTDIELRLQGDRPSQYYYEKLEQRLGKERRELIRRMANLDEWPRGYGATQWHGEVGPVPDGLWQSRDEHPARRPILDSPVAAAWCCFLGQPTDRTTFLVKRMRAHDNDWFDVAYRATWSRLARVQDQARKQQ